MDYEFNMTPVQKELFDKLTGGFNEPKGVMIFCPPPGMGKTRLMEQLLKEGYTVGTFEPAKWNGPDVVFYDEARIIGVDDFRELWEGDFGKFDHVVIDSMSQFMEMHHREMKMARDIPVCEPVLSNTEKPWVRMNTANGIPGKRKKGR